ncbi:MAG TPA: response regulator [Flavobacteriaceae bacterium]|nr:response regulator [Flavobacteriaceae bacterium]
MPWDSYTEIHESIEKVLSEFPENGIKITETHLKSILQRAKISSDKNLEAFARYTLAKFSFEHDNVPLAKKHLDTLFLSEPKIQDLYVLALSHLLETRINYADNDLDKAKQNFSEAENLILKIDGEFDRQQNDFLQKMAFLTEKNAKQQRSLEFNQLAIILGVTMIVVFSLLALAVFKNSRIRTQTTNLLRAKNKQLIGEKNKAEAAARAKTQFLSTITHELRTPIYAVTGLTHLLLTGNPTQEQKEHLNSLKFSGEHLLALINNILDFNKLEVGKVLVQATTFSLKERLENIMFTLKKSAEEKNNRLHLEIDDTIPQKIIGDCVKLSQAIINLTSNALRFTENGDVWIRVKNQNIKDGEVQIYFEVEDNGVGIPEDIHEKIFENFDQGSEKINNKYGGTGLGLPIVKGIVEIMGGEIKLESTTDVGSKFFFSLKFKIDDGDGSHEAEEQERKNESLKNWQKDLSGKKILIVEDNKINQMVTNKILCKHGVKCDLADSGESAIEKVAENQYDLILMDINMPGIGGLEATKQIRKTNLQIPIIALTAVTMEEETQKFLQNGFNDVIPKPYEIDVFFEKIHHQIHSSVIL